MSASRPQVTIAESFNYNLPPNIEITFQGSYRLLPSSSSDSTKRTDAPPAFLKIDVNMFAQLAARALNPMRDQILLHATMPLLENAIAPSQSCLASTGSTGYKIVCASEKIDGVQSRHDIAWSLQRNEPDNRKREKLIAVLEMKSTRSLAEEDFRRATARTDAELKAMVGNSARFKNDETTWLQNNAVVLSKQAAKYGRACKHVAMFDWSAMFIFDFSYGRDRTKGVFFRESATSNGMNFRRLLLAFMLRALG
ncbi:hypothetical protein N7493_004184 [Penicillium malachiteum]|uniref:Uncharacterized protein n=1 Tax=Penicillium malachiteum TaxID=1324776 RepID=A0AAD6HR30_9EURO|nr:hypothetical protein N7493_004184 [Penicillium malachiteum]